MKKSIYMLIGFFSLFFTCSCLWINKTVIFELPSNYSGRVVVEFDCKKSPDLKTDKEGNLIINVDSTGRVVTSYRYSQFVNYNIEKYHWSGEESYYSMDFNNPSRIGSGWSGGRGEPEKNTVKIVDTHTITTSSSGPTEFTYYCTYVFKSADRKFKKRVIDSLRLHKCDCDIYAREFPYDKRCD